MSQRSPHQDVYLGLPDDHAERKAIPIMRGVLDYFPAAIAEVAKISKLGNDQHNPGQPMHWARGKSADHPDTIVRHLMARGTRDTDGARHSAKAAWRALALLQEEIESEAGFVPGAPAEPVWPTSADPFCAPDPVRLPGDQHGEDKRRDRPF